MIKNRDGTESLGFAEIGELHRLREQVTELKYELENSDSHNDGCAVEIERLSSEGAALKEQNLNILADRDTDFDSATALLRRWRKLYTDVGCPEHKDGRLFSETGSFCRAGEAPVSEGRDQ